MGFKNDRVKALAAGANVSTYTDKVKNTKSTKNKNNLETSKMSNNLKHIAFDTETQKITYHNPLPKMMCLT